MKHKSHSKRAEFSDFDIHYNTSLQPRLRRFENERRVRFIIGVFLLCILIPPSFWLAWHLAFRVDDSDSRAIHLVWVIPAGAYMLIMFGLRRRIKFLIMKFVASYLGWQHKPRDKKKAEYITATLSQYNFLPYHDIAVGGDVLHGQHLGTDFALCEIKLMEKEGWGRNQRFVNVFQGCVLSFSLSVSTPATTIITRRTLWINHGLEHLGKYSDASGEVNIWSDDPSAVQTVLCDRFKATISELDLAFPEFDIGCMIKDSWLHIPMTSKDRFEVDWLTTGMDDPSRVQNIVAEFEDVLHLLDVVLKRRYCPKTGDVKRPRFTS